MPESLQHKLDRIRPPRVQITYDVEVGGAIQKKELPFVMGILSDLSGKPVNPPAALKERKFVDIDRDNFNEVLASISPRLAIQVDTPLKDGTKQQVELSFQNIDDFGPLNIIQQVSSLKKLYEVRQRLNDLLAKLDGNEVLDAILTEAGRDVEGLKKVRAALGEGGAR
jgi:type VI secretion system ImpB/VipA family protein